MKVERLLPKLAERYRALVANLEEVAPRDVERGRAELRRIYGGPIRIRQSADGAHVEAAVPEKERLVELAVANGLGLQVWCPGPDS